MICSWFLLKPCARYSGRRDDDTKTAEGGEVSISGGVLLRHVPCKYHLVARPGAIYIYSATAFIRLC